MSLAIVAMLLLLAVLIVAGPLLEDLIDRVWPPRTGPRPPRHHAPR